MGRGVPKIQEVQEVQVVLEVVVSLLEVLEDLGLLLESFVLRELLKFVVLLPSLRSSQ